MKREREEEEEFEVLDMVDSLMLLSRVGEYNNQQRPEQPHRKNSSPAADPGSGKVFVCKTCNRKFSSFQALGGHRASHRKAKFMDVNSGEVFNPLRPPPPAKSETHQCPVCGLQFPVGQALGGHMRRHRSPSAAVLKKSDGRGGGVRLFGVDLNLTPVENNLKLQLVTPFVDCFN